MNDPRVRPEGQPGMQPGTKNADDLPPDQVALMIWHAGAPGGMTVIITRASWEMNLKAVMAEGHQFNLDRIYEFESPINAKGRKHIHHFTGVKGWVANVSTGIIPATGIVPARRFDS